MGKLTHALTLGAADKEQMQENVEDLQEQNRELAKEVSIKSLSHRHSYE